MKLNKTTTVLLVSIILFSANVSTYANPVLQVQTFKKQELTKRTYKLKNFKQSCCYNMVEFILQELEGYEKSEPNMEKQEITVWFNSEITTEKEIIEAINKTGYTVISNMS